MSAKLMIVSPWGKANQKNNTLKTAYFQQHEYDKMYSLLTDPTLHCRIDIADGVPVQVAYRGKEDAYEMTKDTNITVGIWTCAQGRLMTYRYGSQLAPGQLLYMDTDGIDVRYNPNDPTHVLLPTDKDKLGALVNENEELEEKGIICVEFVSGGPKNYGMKYRSINDPTYSKTEIKVKGHNLFSGYADHRSARNTLTYRAMRRLVFKHAIQDPELQMLAVVEAEAEPGEGKHIEEELVESMKITYPERFVLGKTLDITHRDHTITYGWSFDKREIVQDQVCTTFIPTRPHHS